MNIIQEIPKDFATEAVALDIEVFGQGDRLHRPTGTFACISVCFGGEDVYVLTNQSDLKKLFLRLKSVKYWIMHNAMYDVRHLRRWVDIEDRLVWDSMLVEKNLWGGYYGQGEFALSDLVRRYLNIHMDKSTRNEFINSNYMTQEMLEYAAQDAYLTYKVYEKQKQEIEERGDGLRSYWDIDEPTLWSVLDFKPVKVDVKNWRKLSAELEQRGIELEDKLGINVYSWKQVKDFILKRTRVQLPDTSEQTLLDYRDKVGAELIDDILMARRYRKATSTYGESWLEKNVEEGDLVYAEFSVCGAESGRFSSSSPNLQQIPSRKIPEYRKLFISQHGVLMIADIQAQEPRVLAFLSGDQNLKSVFERGEDIHLAVTRVIFHDDTIKKADERRDIGKMVNLATSYGMTADGLAKRLGIDKAEAEKFLYGYFNTYPDVQMFIRRQHTVASRIGFVETIAGRRIWINQYNHQWENNAVNAPIQGSSADFSKLWLNKFRQNCQKCGIIFPVVMVIHDEIVLDIDKEQVDIYKEQLEQAFQETAQQLLPSMPFELETEVGRTWAAKKGEEDAEFDF